MRKSLSIAAIGGHGPKATAVSFVKDDNGHRPWAWLPNDLASQLAPGMLLNVEHVSTGKTETVYTDKAGNTVELKVPRVQLFLGGTVEVDAPEADPVPEITVKVSDAAAKYREAYMAKRAAEATSSSDQDTSEPF